MSLSNFFNTSSEFFAFVQNLLGSMGSFQNIMITLFSTAVTVGIGSWLLHRL